MQLSLTRLLFCCIALLVSGCGLREDPQPQAPADYRDDFVGTFDVLTTSCSGTYNNVSILDTTYSTMVVTPYGTNRVEFLLGYDTVRPQIDSLGNLSRDPDLISEFRISGRIVSSDSLLISGVLGPGCAYRGSQWELHTY